jgi:hypothetical protein
MTSRFRSKFHIERSERALAFMFIERGHPTYDEYNDIMTRVRNLHGKREAILDTTDRRDRHARIALIAAYDFSYLNRISGEAAYPSDCNIIINYETAKAARFNEYMKR